MWQSLRPRHKLLFCSPVVKVKELLQEWAPPNCMCIEDGARKSCCARLESWPVWLFIARVGNKPVRYIIRLNSLHDGAWCIVHFPNIVVFSLCVFGQFNLHVLFHLSF